MKIDHEKRRGQFAIEGEFAPEEAIELAVSALNAALAERLKTLLVDVQRAKSTCRLSVTQSYDLGGRLAAAGRGLHRVAFLLREECMPLHAFLFTVAENRGLCAAAFVDEAQALGWLAGTARPGG